MFTLFPTSLYTVHKGQAGRLLSPRIWSRVESQLLAPDGANQGFFIGSDLRCFGASAAVSSNVGRYGDEACQYLSYEDTGDAIGQIATDRNGAVKITGAATDNNESWIQPGGAASVMALISDTAGSDKLLAFEARVKVGQITETGLFVGLSEEGLAAANTLVDDTGALASKDFIGFHAPMAASDCVLSFVYRKAGQTAQTVISGVHTLVADTYVNLGFVYDPQEQPSKRIKIFVNNEEQSTYVTAANIAASTFPDGEELNFLFGQKAGAAAAKTSTIDGWALYQAG